MREKEEEGSEGERSGRRTLIIASFRHSRLSDRGKTAQKNPYRQKQEVMRSRGEAKALVRKAAPVAHCCCCGCNM
jgi:hypothetical protein